MTMTLTPTLQRSRDAVGLPCERPWRAWTPRVPGSRPTTSAGSTLDGNPQEASGGKAIRPALALLSARAAGADAEIGMPGAVAVELVHNFSLLHDDVMDGDTERRHRPTVWAVWGVPSAILTGDAMLTVAQEVLLDSASPHAADALRLLLRATRELIRGQVEDVAFETRGPSSRSSECQRMAAGKTGALLAASAAIGAVLAGAPAAVVDALTSYGEQLGAAFQLVDDLLGIWGDPAVTGKPVLVRPARAQEVPAGDLRARPAAVPAGRELRGLAAHAAPGHARTICVALPTSSRPAGAAAGRRGEGERRLRLAEPRWTVPRSPTTSARSWWRWPGSS